MSEDRGGQRRRLNSLLLAEDADEEVRRFQAFHCSAPEYLDAGASCVGRLSILIEEIQSNGTDEDWTDAILSNDCAALHRLVEYFSIVKTPLPVKEAGSQCLVLLKRIYPALWTTMMTFQHNLQSLVVEAALQAFDGGKGLDDLSRSERNQLWIMVLFDLFKASECLSQTFWERADLHHLLVIAFDLLDSAHTGNSEVEYNYVFSLLLCLNRLLLPKQGKPNPMVALLSCRAESGHFIETLLHRINEAGYPNHDRPELKWALKLLVDIFEDPVASAFFHFNDTKILCDIILRELQNLGLRDYVLLEYLALISHLLALPSLSKERYRLADFRNSLTALVQRAEEDSTEEGKAVFILAVSALESL